LNLQRRSFLSSVVPPIGLYWERAVITDKITALNRSSVQVYKYNKKTETLAPDCRAGPLNSNAEEAFAEKINRQLTWQRINRCVETGRCDN
jgi:hypothetical protein